MADRERGSERARQLLGYLRARTGTEPLQGPLDPVRQYTGLLNAVNRSLHAVCERPMALDLFSRTTNWFVRMFTTPDAQVRAILDLATADYSGPEQVDQLQAVVADPHHLRLFFGRPRDPAWLIPLYDAGLVPLPAHGEVWPFAAAADGRGRTHRHDMSQLLQRLVVDSRSVEAAPRTAVRIELLRTAIHPGEAGHPVVVAVVRDHGGVQLVQAWAAQVALDAHPASAIVVPVARAVVHDELRMDREPGIREFLELIDRGLSPGNMRERIRFVAGKTRALNAEPLARYTADTTSLRSGVEGEYETIIVFAHHLVRLVLRSGCRAPRPQSCRRGSGTSRGR